MSLGTSSNVRNFGVISIGSIEELGAKKEEESKSKQEKVDKSEGLAPKLRSRLGGLQITTSHLEDSKCILVISILDPKLNYSF